MTSTTSLSHSNVSGFERDFISHFIEYHATGTIETSRLLSYPTAEKPLLFRVDSVDEAIRVAYANLMESLKVHVGVGLRLSSNPNNKVGADLFDTTTGKHIELKLGSLTDLNVGMQSVENIFGKEVRDMFPTNSDRKRWRMLYYNLGEEAIPTIREEHDSKLERIAEYLTNNTPTPDPVQMGHYWVGNNTIGGLITEYNLVVLELQKDLTWKFTNRGTLMGDWKLLSAKVEHNSKRLNIEIVNPALQAALRLTYNYKNNYKLKLSDGQVVKIPAKVGLGTPSFNGWWKPYLTDSR